MGDRGVVGGLGLASSAPMLSEVVVSNCYTE